MLLESCIISWRSYLHIVYAILHLLQFGLLELSLKLPPKYLEVVNHYFCLASTSVTASFEHDFLSCDGHAPKSTCDYPENGEEEVFGDDVEDNEVADLRLVPLRGYEDCY